ncbi:hypothetical protein GJ496_001844, partial [Pomphorhynchus laevis]
AVYIAPLKALVRERVDEWKPKFRTLLNKSVVELTGDYTPDIRTLQRSDLIVTTPEKWDGISRSWQTRSYVQTIELIIIDEIHLLGEDRGPVLEVIVTRANFIANKTNKCTRVIGLSTAIANAVDLANWLGIKKVGMYNFRPSVRPVPLQAHISGFHGEHYCPRMASMNKPCYQAIRTFSPEKPVLVFVSSRRQTRLTAFDLISHLAMDGNPKQWLHMPEDQMDTLALTTQDSNLQLTLTFGIGMHHAGLCDKDRKLVEELFVNLRIQVLIATSTLAWGVNFPAHLVVIKGTEYFDGKLKKYVDFPITDVLQMMGRAGRPQFDSEGVAVIMVQDIKKDFYKKFLYEPFPVESSLLQVLPDHINAEIVSGTIRSKQEAIDYLTWTYFFRRLLENPSYYGLSEVNSTELSLFLSKIVEDALSKLNQSRCVVIEEDERSLFPTIYGRIASFYYVSYKTIRIFNENITPHMDLQSILKLVSKAHEYAELPVRHNEDLMCAEFAKLLPMPTDSTDLFDSPHTKAFLLLQAYFERTELPISDFRTDTKSLLDQIQRILQVLLDLCAEHGWIMNTIRIIHIMQMTSSRQWIYQSSLLQLPGFQLKHIDSIKKLRKHGFFPNIRSLPEMIEHYGGDELLLKELFAQPDLFGLNANHIHEKLLTYPLIELSFAIKDENNVSVGNFQKSCLTKKSCDMSTSIELKINMNYVFEISAIRLNQPPAHQTFKGGSMDNWISILVLNDELLALKRVNGPRRKQKISTRLCFKISNTSERECDLRFFWFNSRVIGLDQQFEAAIKIK